MMKRAVLAVALVAASFGVGSAAEAKTPPTTANVIGVVRIDKNDPTIAYITANYRCYGEGTLFVSIKQVGDRSRNPALFEEGSSQLAIESGGAWSMSHRNPLTCDGKYRKQVFVVDQIETSEFGVPVMPLARGAGYIQFCLFDDNYPLPDDPEAFGEPFYDYGFSSVR